MNNIKSISNKDLEIAAKNIEKNVKYDKEGKLIASALKQFPLNNNNAIISMKICLIDLTHGTNLMKNLGTNGGIVDLSEKIAQVNFDKRVEMGDLTLVNELAKWTKEKIGKNLFSFISKYCLYHNYHCYNRDDYVIYDSVLANNINNYITNDEYKNLTGRTLYKTSIRRYKDNFKYEEYKRIIDFIIKKNNLTVHMTHRKLDWFIWDKYRNKKEQNWEQMKIIKKKYNLSMDKLLIISYYRATIKL